MTVDSYGCCVAVKGDRLVLVVMKPWWWRWWLLPWNWLGWSSSSGGTVVVHLVCLLWIWRPVVRRDP